MAFPPQLPARTTTLALAPPQPHLCVLILHLCRQLFGHSTIFDSIQDKTTQFLCVCGAFVARAPPVHGFPTSAPGKDHHLGLGSTTTTSLCTDLTYC
ncbi:hypothetical protein AB205_0220800 [Aquarana catesbeiana]|uniref:Uncharacterized protein n=1 Tax=Aquarana catesbeiana TaxID=8400 RepID=A0A2G9QBD5_AQUCT|nr:hypothetical protein AB205_0220800 [Aquarana catesbeiana]